MALLAFAAHTLSFVSAADLSRLVPAQDVQPDTVTRFDSAVDRFVGPQRAHHIIREPGGLEWTNPAGYDRIGFWNSDH